MDTTLRYINGEKMKRIKYLLSVLLVSLTLLYAADVIWGTTRSDGTTTEAIVLTDDYSLASIAIGDSLDGTTTVHFYFSDDEGTTWKLLTYDGAAVEYDLTDSSSTGTTVAPYIFFPYRYLKIGFGTAASPVSQSSITMNYAQTIITQK